MVNMFASGALERGLVKNLNKMIFSDSPLSTHNKEVKTKTWLVHRQIMCLNGTTCLHVDLFHRHLFHSKNICPLLFLTSR